MLIIFTKDKVASSKNKKLCPQLKIIPNKIFIGFNETQVFKFVIELWSGEDRVFTVSSSSATITPFFSTVGEEVHKNIVFIQVK